MCDCVCSDCVSPAYQRVQKVESANRRPVLILGPLVEPIKDMLLREAPGKYCRCLPGEIATLTVFSFLPVYDCGMMSNSHSLLVLFRGDEGYPAGH